MSYYPEPWVSTVATLKERGMEGVTWCGTWATLQASENAGVQTCANSYCHINLYAQTSKKGTINREWSILKNIIKWLCLQSTRKPWPHHDAFTVITWPLTTDIIIFIYNCVTRYIRNSGWAWLLPSPPSHKEMPVTGDSLTGTQFISLLLSNRNLKTCLGLS